MPEGFPGYFAESYDSDGASLYQKSGADGQGRCLRRVILPRLSITPNCIERFGVIRSFAKLFGLRFLLDLDTVPEGENHAAIGVHSGLFYQRVPELGREIGDGRLGGFQCFQEVSHGAALYPAPVALCLYALQPLFQFRESLRHPLIFAFIHTLFNAASCIAVDERSDALRNTCHLITQVGGFFFKARRIRQARNQFFRVLEGEIPIFKQRIERGEEFPLDGFFGQVRCVAFVFSLEFPVALPDDAAVFVRGMPHLAAVQPAAAAADELSRKAARAVMRTACLLPSL